MHFAELLKKKQENMSDHPSATIAFLGDSVTQGGFECKLIDSDELRTMYDYKSAYPTRVKEILNLLYPSVQINVINSGIAGDYAPEGFLRLERDILAYSPDLVVVSYGLNDCNKGEPAVEEYQKALQKIFAALTGRGIEMVFLTQNTMDTAVSPYLKEEFFRGLAKNMAKLQNAGILKKYFNAARSVCEENKIKICDIYPVWEKMAQIGINVTELLANKLNHPIREFHYYIAIKLLETILLD